jgi:hypothetical protein
VHHNHVLMIIQLILIFGTTDCNCIGNWNSGKKASMTASSSSTSSQQQQQQTNSKNEDDDGGGGGGGGGENNNNIDNNNNNSKKTTVSSTPGSGSTSTIEDHDDDDVDVDVDMNKTYLDLFGESAKEFLTKKRNIKIIKKINKNIINPENNTLDQNCKWDWKYIRCEPFCECSFQYKLPNDLFYPHLGRACRNRKNQQQVNENENETKKESKDEILYRTYCSNDNDSDSSNDDNNDTDKSRRVPPPPPPSIQIHIPSPIPIVTRYVKSIWRIIRNKSDIVMNHANNEFEIVHGKLQNIVCQDLKTRCDSDSDSDDNNGNKQNSSSSSYSPIITMVAWQERLLCQEIIRECVVVVVDGEE